MECAGGVFQQESGSSRCSGKTVVHKSIEKAPFMGCNINIWIEKCDFRLA
jgi:hypothetical protein